MKITKSTVKMILRSAALALVMLVFAGSLFSCESAVEKLRQELLTGVISEAEALIQDEWKPSSYEKVEAALAAAKEAMNAEKPDKEAIRNAKAALEEALASLSAAADKRSLQSEYDRLSSFSLIGYTKASAEPLTAALTDAAALLADGNAEQETVDRAAAALKTAEEGLTRPDKSGLQAEYDRLSALSLTRYTKASAEPLTAALTDTAAILADEEASEDSVNNAVAALKTAEEGLTRPDKSGLQAEYDRLSAVSLTGYTKASAEPLTAALTEIATVLADEEASEDSVNNAVAALKTAEEGLTRPDKSGLQTEYDRLSALSLKGYTDKSANAMKTALESASAVLAGEEASEEDIANATASLKNAETGLVKKQTTTNQSGNSSSSGNSSQSGSSGGGNQSGNSGGSSQNQGGNSSSGNGTTPSASTKAGRLEIAKAEAKKWVAENVKPGMTKMDIVEEIAYWFPRYVKWQTNQGTEAYKTNYGNEAYSAFVMKISACSGTCRAIKLICDAAGLNCEHVNEGEWDHQWLRIQVDDGSWKIVDGQCGYVGDTEIGNYAPTPYWYVKWRQEDYDYVIAQTKEYYKNWPNDAGENLTFVWDESLRVNSETGENAYYFANIKYLENLGVRIWNIYGYIYEQDGTVIPDWSLNNLLEASTTRKVRYNCYQATTDLDPTYHSWGMDELKDDGSGKYKVIVFIVDTE